jgi:3-deoxy-manno-octulosonate cytidylyltransferase (CMP-KDO synthetase)
MAARALGVIPVRMDATRLPGKPLLRLDGRTIVQWVYDAAVASAVFDDVVVATPDDDIADAVRAFGGAVAMTGRNHATGTDRVAEVARTRADVDIVANVQGDQPFVTSEMLLALIDSFASAPDQNMATLGAPLDVERGLHDPNTVKVVTDQRSFALYFSRAPIPTLRTPRDDVPVYHHLGIYAFTRDYLLEFATLPPTPLEQCENLEQLRALEHGARIRVCPVAAPTIEINTLEDLECAEHFVARTAS